MAKTRAYLVETSKGKRIVEASGANVAVNHVIRNEVKVKALTTGELLAYLKEGMKPETVTSEDAE